MAQLLRHRSLILFVMLFHVNPFLMELGDALDNTKLVRIAIGTGGHGHWFPGATMPFGAVQLSPDTGTKDWGSLLGLRLQR